MMKPKALAGKKRETIGACALCLLALMALLGGAAAGRWQDGAGTRLARKIDGYRLRDMGGHDEQMRLWGASDALAKEPADSRLFIIAYGHLPGSAGRYAARARNYLVSGRGLGPERLVAVDGGFQAEPSVEIWLVPAGASEPVAKPGGHFDPSPRGAWKYDEYPLQGWWFGDGGRCCEGRPERLDGFAAVLKAHPKAKAYLLVHKGETHCETCLEPGKELEFAKEEKKYLARQHRLASSRISIYRGTKTLPEIELWVVPDGTLDR